LEKLMTTATQTLAKGTALWRIDATHANVEFGVRHLMISTVKGRFGTLDGTVTVEDGDPTTAQIDVTIEAASLDTRVEQRDAHLRSADFFDVEKYPALTFTSKRVERAGEDDLRVVGDLTIRGVTREVALDVEELGTVRDPWGNDRAAFSAKGKIDRTDFGLTWNQAIETGGVLVGDQVKLSIEVELVRQAD
jgi:polyisoprenoid-binding protein YceI